MVIEKESEGERWVQRKRARERDGYRERERGREMGIEKESEGERWV